MNNLKKVEYNPKQVCTSAYKVLLFLKLLIFSPMSFEEINEFFQKDEILNTSVTKENLNIFRKTLKFFGCKINKPVLFNKFKYSLEECPFLVTLDKEEIDLINKFRQNPYEKNDWKTILFFNSFINKLCLVINKKSHIEKLKNCNALSNIDSNMVLELNECCKKRNFIVFRYKSGIKINNIEMATSFLKYERDKLYIWGFSPIYNDFIALRADKILSYKVYEEHSPKILHGSVIRYINFNKDYVPDENESFIEETPEGLIIDYKASNNFFAIQKFLEMGCDCKILSPEYFKRDFVNAVKSIQKRCSDDK